MFTLTDMDGRATRRAAWLRRIGAAAALAGLAACSPDEILEVEDPDVARPEAVRDSASLPAVLAGALGNVGHALNGTDAINQVALAGMISDEYINTETFPTRIEVDQRRQQYQSNGSLSTTFYSLQQARTAADLAADGFRKFLPNDPGLGEALNLSAITLILMAENYCGSVPLSRQMADESIIFGPSLTTRQLLDRAIEKVDSALGVVGAATSGNGLTQARVARVLKARALLNLNQPAQAAAAIGGTAGVPTTFRHVYVHSEVTPRQNNGTWSLVQNSGRFGVADLEGTNGLPFRSEGDTANMAGVRDPRVANVRRPSNNGRGFDGSTNMWWQLQYPLRASPTVIADGVEARLIEAEASLAAGDYPTALATLNALRSDAALRTARGYTRTMPALAPVVGAAAQQDQLFRERAYWLFLTSHRLGDMRRLTRPTAAAAPEISGYGRGIETVYPTGTYHKSGTYGTDVNSPIPQAEDNNPEFTRSTCNVAKP